MGKFGIGARVRNAEGTICEVVGKPKKGVREIRLMGGHWDGAIYWADKSSLEPVTACAETSENAYLMGGDTENKWVPKVGDRVRFLERYGSARIGDEATITGFWDVGGDPKGGFGVELANGRTASCYARRVEPVVAPATTAATSALQIESGKFYRTRDGRKVGPVAERGETWTDYPWVGTVVGESYRYIWKDDGENYNGAGSVHDLVAEWVEPAVVAVAEATATPSRRFKVGDVVNYVFDGRPQDCWQGVVITKDDGRLYHATCPKHGEGAFYEVWLEPATPPAKFKVGDRVNWTRFRHSWQGIEITAIRPSGEWPVSATDPVRGLGDFGFDELELASNSLPIGSTVTFTATGRLSAINDNGHMQVTFPGLPAGRNSFALPADYVALAN